MKIESMSSETRFDHIVTGECFWHGKILFMKVDSDRYNTVDMCSGSVTTTSTGVLVVPCPSAVIKFNQQCKV